MCRWFAAGLIVALHVTVAPADDWPQWRGPTRDGIWRETGLIEKFAGPEVPILWRAPIGPGYSGPTVYRGLVYITDRVVEPSQQERVLAFDAKTGKPAWSHVYDCAYARVGYQAGPRASIACDEDRAYSLGTMGHLFCFNAADGKVVWQHDLDKEYKIGMPIWGIAASPLVEGEHVIIQVGGEGACLVAFDKHTGKEAWRALDDQASYAAPIMVTQNGRRVLLCMTGENVVGLNPATGEVYWTVEFKPTKMPIGVATPIVGSGRVFMTSFYDGGLMVKLNDGGPAGTNPSAEKLWHRRGFDERRTDALQSIISTPLFIGDYVYGVDSYGELRCLDAATGDRLWEDLTAVPRARWSTIHFVHNTAEGAGDRVWMFNERGDLIIARLTPKGYEELSRAKLIEPTTDQLGQRGGVCWAHPAYADKCVFARNDKELVCGKLAK